MDFNSEIFLESERLIFRQHIPADREAYCAMEQDAEVRRYVGGHPRTREEAEIRFTKSLEPVTGGLAVWATVLKSGSDYIGRSGIYPHFNQGGEPIAGEASLGFYIAKPFWGQGYATEAGNAFITFGFNELNLKRIVTMVDVRNNASVRVLKKLGFLLMETEIGVHRSFYHFVLENIGITT